MSEFPIVLVKNLPYNSSSEALYTLFGRYGTINQLRVPDEDNDNVNLGSCFIVYSNLASAKKAASELNGINFEGRYLVSTMYQFDKSKLQDEDLTTRKQQVEKLKLAYGID